MDGFDLFRKFLGIDRNFPDNGFKMPIWGDDTGYDDDDEFDLESQEQNPTNGFGIRVFTGDPLDMHRAFERQFDELMRGLMGAMSLKEPLDFPGLPAGPEDNGPYPTPRLPESPHSSPDNHPRSRYLKPSYESSSQPSARRDSDLDGKITSRDIGDLFEHRQQVETPIVSAQPQFFGQSSFSKTIRGPDGRVEHHKTFKSSDGSDYTTVTRQLGDQTHTVTVKKNKNGTTEQNEDFVNMSEDDLSRFNQMWSRGTESQLPFNSNRALLPPSLDDSTKSWSFDWLRKWF